MPAPRESTDRAERASTASVGIYGASGTTGVELARLLHRHPDADVAFATSRSESGATLDAFDPAAPRIPLVHPDEADLASVDAVFLCVPHGTAGPLAERCVTAGVRVIDVSGDHRLRDADLHRRTYGSERSEALAERAVYGLTEFARDQVRDAKLVANPGCYATASILGLAPLAAAGFLTDLSIVDAKSGVSGAGRAPTATNHFCSVSEDVRPYKVGRVHRHVAEIEQELAAHDPEGRAHRIVFNPHLVPLERGIEATIVVRGADVDDVRSAYARTYEGEPFIRVLPPDETARIRAVARTNRADIGVCDVEGTDAVVVTVALDNLVKGAAGQAVQNLNVMLGLAET
ncbi:MAG: N-acetyl-gamma-glutamyl-phosphate reductase, partial [Planctomycetota bacterium]